MNRFMYSRLGFLLYRFLARCIAVIVKCYTKVVCFQNTKKSPYSCYTAVLQPILSIYLSIFRIVLYNTIQYKYYTIQCKDKLGGAVNCISYITNCISYITNYQQISNRRNNMSVVSYITNCISYITNYQQIANRRETNFNKLITYITNCRLWKKPSLLLEQKKLRKKGCITILNELITYINIYNYLLYFTLLYYLLHSFSTFFLVSSWTKISSKEVFL